jgi:tRNA-2-methylthio-N6-dimethylallyladenosine synthase
MNEYDSERIAAMLESKGFLPAISDSAADIVILNTCSVRERPQHKVESFIGQLRKSTKRFGKPQKVGIMGCVAQQMGQAFLKRFSNVDFVLGTDRLSRLPEVLELISAGERIADIDTLKSEFSISPFKHKRGISSSVTVMKGCDNFCSYCIVPYVRGRETSRSPIEILDEIKNLTDMGVRDITLLGQNVNSYSSLPFAELLSRAAQVEGVLRLRFMTSHPKDLSMDIVHAMAEHKNICRYIHLPLQSGSNRILELMNRRYTWEGYYDKILQAKAIIPELIFSSDFIVGFPGESEADFEDTLSAVRTMRYESIYAFNYSVRPGTAAEKLADDLPLVDKTARLNRLQTLQEELSLERYNAMLGKSVSVLVEGVSKRDDGAYTGRTVHSRIMNFTSETPVEVGTEIDVEITEVKRNTLYGVYR